jgi:LmbE family N-acetylglucosaminyl deacetylase
LALLRLTGRDPRKWGRNEDIDLTEVFRTRFPVNARVNYREVADIKKEAISCHASQLDQGSSSTGLAGALLRLLRSGTVDTYMRSDPPVTNGRIERDLYEGIRFET